MRLRIWGKIFPGSGRPDVPGVVNHCGGMVSFSPTFLACLVPFICGVYAVPAVKPFIG
jgi:hypothetical protein